jgi:hypothetical protein
VPDPVEKRPAGGPARPLLSMGMLLLVAVVFVALAAINLWGEAVYSLSGVPASGKVIEFHATQARSRSIVAQVDVVVPGAAPFRWEVDDTLGLESWEVGGSVPLLCAHIHADHLSCVIDSWTDRFLVPLIFLAIGAGAIGLVLRGRRAAAA